MKVLHIINSLEIGGAQRLVVDILPKLQTKQCQASLLVLQKPKGELFSELKKLNIDIYTCKISSLFNPVIFFKILYYSSQFDILHFHLFPSLYWGALISFFSKKKIVYTEHSTHNKRREKTYLKWIERVVYSRYNKIISITPQTQEKLLVWLEKKENHKFVVINNGIDLTKFKPSLKKQSKKIMMVSRFSLAKDQVTVINAFSILTHKYPELTLHFIGDGETLTYCKQLVSDLNLNEKVFFLGNRSNIVDLIQDCFCGIQSSFWEGFGLTAVEFMAVKKPIIASDVEGLSQVVSNAGLLFPVQNATILSQIIEHLLTDQLFYNEIAEKCYQRAIQYDINKLVDQYINIYKSIL